MVHSMIEQGETKRECTEIHFALGCWQKSEVSTLITNNKSTTKKGLFLHCRRTFILHTNGIFVYFTEQLFYKTVPFFFHYKSKEILFLQSISPSRQAFKHHWHLWYANFYGSREITIRWRKV